MIRPVSINKYNTRSGWKKKYLTENKDVSLKEVTIACGWNKHFLRGKPGFIYILDGIGQTSINHKDDKIVTAHDYFEINENSIVSFQYSQLKYLYFKNMGDFEKITVESSTNVANQEDQTTILYVLDGVGSIKDKVGNRVVIREEEAYEINGEDLIDIKGNLTILKMNT